MPLTTLIPATFPEAELSALRLDGDCFRLGEMTVPADAPVDTALRAASLAPATDRHDLVVAGWTAAWLHGAWPVLRRPLTLCLDVGVTSRTRTVATMAREVRFAEGDVTRISGVLVTTPLRTAVDLARLEERFAGSPAAAALALLEVARLTPAAAAALADAAPRVPHKRRCVERLGALRGAQPAGRPKGDENSTAPIGVRRRQPADTL